MTETADKKQGQILFETEEDVYSLYLETKQQIVIYQGVVYDVSEYIQTHPGGTDVIEKEFGKSIDIPFEEAEHTKSARNIFKDLPIVGKMKCLETSSTNSSNEGVTDQKQNGGGIAELYKGKELNSKLNFDYNKGLFWQMMFTDWTFEEYTQYINEPKHLVNPVRNLYLFEFFPLELVTMTPWWLIPAFWFPIAGWHIAQSELDTNQIISCVIAGAIQWSFFEYFLHRFLFHSEDQPYFVKHPKFYVLHFFIHGVHHAFPNDHYRIVFPPILGIMVYAMILPSFFKHILPVWFYDSFAAGIIIGYVMYDSIHYQLHKSNPEEGSIVRKMKKEHMQHHYKNGTVGFGVTNKFWDTVFDTRVTEENMKMKKS